MAKKLTVKELEAARKAINKDEEDEKKARAKAAKTAAPVYTYKEAGSKVSPPAVGANVGTVTPPKAGDIGLLHPDLVRKYLEQGMTYAKQGPQSRQQIADSLLGFDIGDHAKGAIGSFSLDAMQEQSLRNRYFIGQHRQAGTFDSPEFLKEQYITMPSTAYLGKERDAALAALEESKKKDDADKLYQSNLQSTRGAWEQLEAEKNNPYMFDPMYGYAMMEYLQGDRSEPFNYDQWDYEYQNLSPADQQARLAGLKTQWDGLDFDALTGRNYKYESQTPGLQAQYDLISGQLANREKAEELEAFVRSQPDFSEKSQYVDGYTAPEKGSLAYIFSNDAFVQGLDDPLRFIHSDANWATRELAGEYSGKAKYYFEHGYHLMAPEQRYTYTYLYKSGMKKEAAEYLAAIQPELNKAMSDITTEYYTTRDETVPGAIIDSLWSVPGKIKGTLDTGAGILMDKDDPNDPLYRTAQNVDTIRGVSGQTAGELLPVEIFGQKAGTFLYGLGMSTLDMIAAQQMAGVLGTATGRADTMKNIMGAIMATEAGTDTFRGDLERGMGFEYAIGHGIANGLVNRWAESGFLDNLFSENGKFLTKVLKSGGSEGLEEVFESGMNLGTDAFVSYLTGKQSEVEQTYNYYVATVGKDKAAAATMQHYANQFASDGLAGFIMGGTTSAVYNTTDYIGNRSTGKALTKDGDPDRMLGIAKSMPEGSEARRIAEDIEGKVSGGKEMSLGDLGRMTNALAGELREEYGSTVKQVMNDAIASRLMEVGSTPQKARRNADAIRKIANGENITLKERAGLMWDDAASQVTKEILGQAKDPALEEAQKNKVEETLPAGIKGYDIGEDINRFVDNRGLEKYTVRQQQLADLEAKLQESGVGQEESAGIAQIIQKAHRGEKLTKAERDTLENNEYAQQLANEMDFDLRQQNIDINKKNSETLLDIASKMPEGSVSGSIANQIAESIEGRDQKGMTFHEFARLATAMSKEVNGDGLAVIRQMLDQAIENRLVEYGETLQDARKAARTIRRMALGQSVSASDRVDLTRIGKSKDDILNEFKVETEFREAETPVKREKYYPDWVKQAKTAQATKAAETFAKMAEAQAAANTKNVSATVKEAVKRGADKVEAGKNGQPAAKETDRNITYIDGGETGSGRLARFEEVDGKLTMAVVTGKGKDGKDTTVNVPLDSLNKASGKGTAGLIEAVKDINENLHPVSAEEASTMLATYELTGGDVGAFVENYERAYLSGYSGANNVSVAIDPKLAQMARESGQRQAEKDEQQRLQRAGDYKALETTVAGWLGKVSDNSQVHGMGDAEALAGAMERMTETQRRTAEICMKLGKALGLNVVLFESDVKNLRGIQNGSFDEASHTVYLDINSGVGSTADLEAQRNSGTLGAAMLRVMSHELTHYLEVASPEMYAKYKAAVRAGLKAAGKETDMALLIREKIDRALNAGRKMSYKAAEAEVIADASEYMLKDSKFTNDLDPTLKGKIKTFIQHFAQKVKEIFNHLTGGHKESAALREMKNGVLRYMDGLQELWDAGFDEITGKGTTEQADADAETAQQAVEELEPVKRFSMDRDVELREDGLIAMHNLKESDVRGTLALGGFPMPSIAIVKAKDGHTMYGDYSVLFGKETIDPANKKNRVYGADAWRPVFPHVETQIHDDILYDVQEGFRDLAAQVDEEYGKKARIWFGNFSGSDVTSKSLDDIAESAANNTGVMAAYLADHGETVEVVETDAPVDQGYKPERADQYDKILDIIDMNDYFNMPMHELLDTYGDRLAEVSGQLSRFNAYWKTGDRRSGAAMARVLQEAIAYDGAGREKTVKTKRVKDYYATDDAIRARVDRKDVEAWAKEKLAPAFGEQGIYNGKDRFTPSGNRRSFKQTHNALTADNVVKSMLTQEESAIPVTDAKGLMAAAASMYKSIAEIKGDANRLGKISEEEYNARIAAADNAFRDFLNAIEAWDYDQIQDVGKLLVQAAKGRMDAKAISALLKRNGFPKATIKASIMAENVIQQVQTIPTGYFEAKPARVVGFDEIRMIVAPDTMPESLAALLDERGIPYTTYDGSDADRLEKVNAVEGVRFSDRDDYLLDGSEYGRFRRSWESRKTNHFTKRTNGGVLIDMGNLLVYTDRKGNPQHVLEVMTEDLWEENDIVQRAILLETGGYDKDEQQEILGRIFPEGSFRFRIPGDRSSDRGQNGRGSKRDVGKVRREDREEKSYEGATPEVQVKRYSDRDLPDSITVREYLSGLKPTSRMTETEKILLKRYQERLTQLEEKEKQVSEQEEIIRTAPFRNPDGSLNDEINKAKNRYKIYRDQANRISRELLNYERDEGFAGILATGRQVVQELTMGSAGGIADAADALETEVAELTARLTRLEAEVTRTAAGQRNAYARGLYDPKALNDAAKQLKDTYGSRMSVKSIADRLALTFGELYASEGTEGARMFSAAAKDLAVDLLQGNRFRYKSEILPMLKEKIGTISLTETDVQEIENRGYTLREYRSMLSPYIKVTTGGSDLSSVASNANYFGDGELAAVLEDETEGNLAMRLFEVISNEKAREAEIAYEGMTESQLIGMAMADIAGANLPMSANNQTVEYLRKELLKYAGENADVAIAVEEAIGKARATTSRASNVWREAVKHTETARQAVEYYRKLEEQRRLLELADQKKTLTEQLRSDNAQKLKEKVEAQKAEYREREQKAREYRKSRVELDKVRKRISKNVKTINALRVRETDKKHVPQQLQLAADLLMQTFTDTNLGRLAFPQEKLDSLSRTYRLLLNEEADATYYWDDEIEADIENLRALSEAYTGLKNKKDGAPSAFTLEGVEYETEILRGVDNVVANILNMIDAWNDNFLRNRTETFEAFANKTGEQLRQHDDYKVKKGWMGKLQNMLDEGIRTGNMTPIYFFDHLKNPELLAVFDEIREGMHKAAMIEREGKEYIERVRTNRNYGKWVADGKLKMKTGNGHTIELTREEACEIYAIAKREKANKLYQTEHLLYGGFQYKHIDQHVSEDGKHLVQDMPHQLDAADLEKIGNWLTDEQKGYADDLVAFLSTRMAEYGNDASMAMYGYEKFTESYYIPFRTVAEQRYLRGDEGPQGDNAGTGRLLNSGFTKKLQHKANATLYVGGISETVAEHIHKMAAYSEMVQPIENLKRLLNHKVLDNDGTANTLRALIGQKYGRAAENYMTQLLKDLNGATQSDQRAADLPDKLVSAFKRGAVMASASVVLQQPTAMARAMALISPKYFAQNPFYRPSRGTWEKMMKYSGAAIIKDMGKYDVGMGKTASQYILDEDLNVAETYQRLVGESKTKAGKAALDRFIDWLTSAPGKADQWTWGLIWKAAEAETAALNPRMDRNSDEFLRLVGKRFDDVVDHTQVYDSVLTKSNLMRSQNGFHKMATSFMAEPTLSINMLYDALTGKHGKKQAARIIGSVAASQVLAGALAALVQAWNDDEDERNWMEKYADRASSNIFSNINVFGMIPYVSDIVSLFEGYDVERPDLSVIADVMDYTKKYFKGFEDGGIPSWKDTENFVGTLANLVGVPAKNISREIRRTRNAILNTDWSAPSAFNLGQVISENTIFNSGKNTEYYQRIVTAELRGDTKLANNLRSYMLTSKMATEDKMKSGIKTALKDAYIAGDTDDDTAIDMLVKIGAYADREDAYWEVDKWQYMQETGESADSYGKYSNFFTAVETGTDLKATIQIYLDNGVSKSTLASKITSQYKPQLIALKQSGKGYADLQARILTAYEALGYDRNKKLKDIQKWFEDKK